MFAAPDSITVHLPDAVRTTTFRWTAGAFALCIVLFAAFVYWKAADYLMAKTDDALTEAKSRDRRDSSRSTVERHR